MYQMAQKFTNLFHSKAIQKLTEIGIFWFENIPSGNPGGRYENRKNRI
jgi:hypothetical protein